MPFRFDIAITLTLTRIALQVLAPSFKWLATLPGAMSDYLEHDRTVDSCALSCTFLLEHANLKLVKLGSPGDWVIGQD